MLVTLAEMKTYLGIVTNTYDAFLTEQIQLFSAAIENYCGRKFNVASYTEKFYAEDFDKPQKYLETFHYPITSVTSIKEDDVVITEYRLQANFGRFTSNSLFFLYTKLLEISYAAGYAVVPAEVKSVVYSLVEERYNKKISGVSLNFGQDVQRISIPGTISIDFDYTLNNNERKNKYGVLLGSYVNILDSYRSGRAVVGSGVIPNVT
jgi:hypothetical protein